MNNQECYACGLPGCAYCWPTSSYASYGPPGFINRMRKQADRESASRRAAREQETEDDFVNLSGPASIQTVFYTSDHDDREHVHPFGPHRTVVFQSRVLVDNRPWWRVALDLSRRRHPEIYLL